MEKNNIENIETLIADLNNKLSPLFSLSSMIRRRKEIQDMGNKYGWHDSNLKETHDLSELILEEAKVCGEVQPLIFQIIRKMYTLPINGKDTWLKYPENKPTEYGKYWVYRNGCNKQHYEVWNTCGWAYNNNDITHFMPLGHPKPPTE